MHSKEKDKMIKHLKEKGVSKEYIEIINGLVRSSNGWDRIIFYFNNTHMMKLAYNRIKQGLYNDQIFGLHSHITHTIDELIDNLDEEYEEILRRKYNE